MKDNLLCANQFQIFKSMNVYTLKNNFEVHAFLSIRTQQSAYCKLFCCNSAPKRSINVGTRLINGVTINIPQLFWQLVEAYWVIYTYVYLNAYF